MYIWCLTWLCLRLEFCINLGRGTDFMLHFLPCVPLTVSPKEEGYRYVSLSCYWLIFQITLSYHMPYGLVYDNLGHAVGYNMYPSYRVDVIDARN